MRHLMHVQLPTHKVLRVQPRVMPSDKRADTLSRMNDPSPVVQDSLREIADGMLDAADPRLNMRSKIRAWLHSHLWQASYPLQG